MTILGIDLGTTNSLCAIFEENQPILIPNVYVEYLTPSAITINTVLVQKLLVSCKLGAVISKIMRNPDAK